VPGWGGKKVEDRESDYWRPSPEEYKMGSKEKRQLRNKISARNFRVRRKGEFPFLFLSPFIFFSGAGVVRP